MAKRAVASAVISFGLVTIPVKFYIVASAESIASHMVTPAGNRVKQKLVDAVTGEDVERSACSNGYEALDKSMVVLTKDELSALGDSDGGSMEVREFIPAGQLNPLEVEKSYYLDAGKGGDKAYRLLAQVLKSKKRCAVCQWSNRGRQHLVVLSEKKGVLVAHQMYYSDEVRDFDLDCATYTAHEKEVELAGLLVDSMSSPKFDSSKYCDTYRSRLLEAIAAKQRGGSSVPASVTASPASADLFAALTASLQATAKPSAA